MIPSLRSPWRSIERLEGRTVPASFVVTTTADAGAGSLRQAMLDANAAAGLDTISFAPAAFATAQSITLLGGAIAITDHVVVAGPGAPLQISGALAARAFLVAAAAPLNVTLNDLTFVNGLGGTSGGAISAGDDSLTLNRCTFANNSASQNGGAVAVDAGGTVVASDCTFTANAANNGGAVFGGGPTSVDASLTFERCVFSGNTASFDGGAVLTDGFLLISDSTLSGNVAKNASGGGGAIRQSGQFNAPPVTIRNSTLSGNSTAGSGGAIRLFNSTGPLTVQNSTIVHNSAGGAAGGGIARDGGTATVAIASSIVSRNVNAASPDLATAGSVNATTSLIGTKSGVATFIGDALTIANLGVDPLLGPLQDNGGTSLTHLPSALSPAINYGDNPAALANDQRGPGFPRSVGTTDIGAVELRDLVVTNANDSGVGSLRQAVADSLSRPGADTIVFEPTIFNSPRTISLLTVLPIITDDTSILGPGAGLLTVRRDPAAATSFSVFRFGGSGTKQHAIADLTVTGGASSGITVVDQKLTLDRVVVAGNSGGSGGGIFGNDAAIVLRASQVANNSASGNGGGILALDSSVTIDGSTISGNTSGTGRGGGVNVLGLGGLSVEGSTVSGNSAGNHGGGLYVDVPAGYQIRNSTISGNSSSGRGGGIGLNQSIVNVTLTIRNSTITGNKAAIAGGGIASLSSFPGLLVQSSVIAGNLHAGNPDISMSGSVQVGKSLIGSPAGWTLTDLGGNLAFGANPLLGPLADNGGPTRTHALLAGSPLINAGSNPAALAFDQRGGGFPRNVGGVDIGAFEFQPTPTKVTSVAINNGDAQRSRVTSVAIAFDSTVTLPINPADAFQLKRQSDGAVVSLGVVQLGASITLSFAGGPVNGGSLADGRYTLTILASQLANLDGNGDGTAGDDFTLVGAPANGLFRLFGDADGNGQVGVSDFLAFRLAFLSPSATFDFNNNGTVDAADFIQFRLRFLQSV